MLKLIVCKLAFVIVADGIPWAVNDDVEGKVLNKGNGNYIVDFREGLKKYPLTKNPKSYDKILIEANKCVEE